MTSISAFQPWYVCAYKCRKLGNMKYFTKELHCGLQRTHPPTHIARRLQSCVGTQARLGYAEFDAESLFCHYTVRYTVPISLCVGVFACMSTHTHARTLTHTESRYVVCTDIAHEKKIAG